MNKTKLFLLGLFISLQTFSLSCATKLTGREAARSAVQLNSPGSQASGFMYRGHLITAKHVCTTLLERGPAKLTFILKTQQVVAKSEYWPEAMSEDSDVCSLMPVDPVLDASFLLKNLGPGELYPGDAVTIVGSPRFTFPTITKGYHLGEPNTDPLGHPNVTIHIKAIPGNSGGPCLNERGQLVGMVSTSFFPEFEVAGMVTLKQIDAFIDKISRL